MLKLASLVHVENSQEEFYEIVVVDDDQQYHAGKVYVGTDVLEFEIPELDFFMCGQPSVGITESIDLEYIQTALNEMCC